jgi:hypothetical protein
MEEGPVSMTIPVITGNNGTFSNVKALLETKDGEREVRKLDNYESALEYLNIEMPELVLIDFADAAINARGLLDAIRSDPWLHHGGLIILSGSYEQSREIEEIRDCNIIAVIGHDEIDNDLGRIMTIIDKNRRILMQGEIREDFINNISGSFKLDNHFLEVRCYSNLVCNFLYTSKKIDSEEKNGLVLTLVELLINAVEHGNCGIGYEEKSEYLDKGGYIENLIEKRCQDPSIAQRRVTFEYTLEVDKARFFIADEGEGFDWRRFRKKEEVITPESLLELHGRGIMMSQSVVGPLEYNDKGNAVSFTFAFKKSVELTPALFSHMQAREVSADETIFREGEASNFLYYIVKGQYDVIHNETIVSTLTPDDIFMGEMSFLLNNKRSAAVRARTSGKLIEVSKKAFIEAIKRKPHYAIFLSRLLAQRIQRLNNASDELRR